MPIELMNNTRTIYQSWGKGLYCRVFISRFWFWSVFTEILCLPHLPSLSWPETWQWCSFSWPVQYGLLMANTLNFFLLGNPDVLTFSFSGNKPHPSDLICRRNSVKFLCDPSPWKWNTDQDFLEQICPHASCCLVLLHSWYFHYFCFFSFWVVSVEGLIPERV